MQGMMVLPFPVIRAKMMKRGTALLLVVFCLGMFLFITAWTLALDFKPPKPPPRREPPRVDPRAVRAAQAQESVQIIVYLSEQPGSQLARWEQEAVWPEMAAIESQIKELTQPFRMSDVIPVPVRAAVRDLNRQREAVLQDMRESIISQVRAIIKPQQDAFVAFLERELKGKILARLTHTNSVGVEIPSAMLDRVANHPDVLRIRLNAVGSARGELTDSIPTIVADDWHSRGYNGDGYDDVAILDSGIYDHDNLSSRLGAAHAFYGESTSDVDGHGTQVAGVVASSHGTYTGVAPGIDELINAKVIKDAPAQLTEANVELALEWSVTGEINGTPDPGISDYAEIVNFSHGFDVLEEDYSDLAQVFDIYVDDYDVHITKSAGNEGSGSETLTEPADAYNIIVVGAMNDAGLTDDDRSDDSIRSSSSRGPTYDDRKKPDLVAPGDRIDTTDWGSPGNKWNTVSGTSFAAPHVAGAIALLMDVGPWTPINVKSILINTAEHRDGDSWDAAYGWGYIDLDEAWDHRWHYHIAFIEQSEDYWLTGTMPDGGKLTLVWNCHGNVSDVDLRLYEREQDGSLGDLIASSVSWIDNVEQIVHDEEDTSAYVKITGYDINDVASERVSLTHPGGFTACSEPSSAPAKYIAAVESGPEDDLGQNFPNPFNPDTWIPYSVSETSEVKIQIFDATGKLVRTLELGRKAPGEYVTKQKAAYWDGRNDTGENAASGVYFYYLTAGDYGATRKMIMTK